MSVWTRILTLSLLPVAAVALGSAPTQESAPAKQVASSHKKKSNPSAEHGATKKSTAGANASLNPQPIPPGRTKTASRKSTAGADASLNPQPIPPGHTKTASSKSAAAKKTSTKKSTATSSRQTGNDKGIIFVGGKKTQKTQKTRT